SYLPADFNGLERLGLRLKPRVALAVTSPPDRDGWLSFGVQAGASYRPFLEAARDPERLAIAEVNPRMPRIEGIPELGGNRVHVSEVDAWVEHDTELVTLPEEQPSPEDLAIARQVCERILPDAILQLGNAAVRLFPVTDVNGPSVLCRLPRLTSINGALSIDLAGQVAADAVAGRQYSGAGGHESFVSGAAAAPEGRSFLCLKSTAKVGG